MSRADPYELVAAYRGGWKLVKHRETGQHYLRRMMRGQYKVTATKSGFASWDIRDETGQRLYPERLK